MSAEPEIVEREPAAVATSIACRSIVSLERGIADLLFGSSLKSNKGAVAIPSALNHDERVQTTSGIGTTGVVGLPSIIQPAVRTCAISGQPLTQPGLKRESLRRLVGLGFLSDSQQPDKSETGRRLTPGPLKYDHFEVEVGADGFPIELGAGAMAITYRARDTVLNSVVALKVIDRKVAQNPGARSRFLREARAAAN